MSDEEHKPFSPLDAVEMAHAFAGVAASMWTFFDSLRNEGFTDDQALRITVAYAHGSAGGKLS